MKIDHLETIHLRYEYADGFTYAGGTCTARVTSLVLVHTDSGQVGVGAAYSHPGLIELIVKQQLEPFLVGQDPTQVESLWGLMYRLTRWYGRKGAAMTAIGAIDTALWDLRGQARGKPVWQLLGGDQPKCPAYASALLWKAPDELAGEAAALIEKGFRRVKMRLGRDADFDIAAVQAVRRAIGPDNDVLVDGSMRYNPQTARELASVLEANNVFWLEEPFEPEDLDLYSALREEINVPLAAGENEFGAQGFRELIRTAAVDIVQPDASRCGGISEVKAVADLAQAAGLRVASHTWSDAVAIMANAHVISTLPHGITVEVDQTGNPFVEELLVEPLEIRDGVLQLSNAAGLGVALNRDVIERYRLKDPMTLPAGAYSDMVFGREFFNPAPPT
jgi:L-alanine-DL-glutamate epimerase-like enolase superfamily enzyme